MLHDSHFDEKCWHFSWWNVIYTCYISHGMCSELSNKKRGNYSQFQEKKLSTNRKHLNAKFFWKFKILKIIFSKFFHNLRKIWPKYYRKTFSKFFQGTCQQFFFGFLRLLRIFLKGYNLVRWWKWPYSDSVENHVGV